MTDEDLMQSFAEDMAKGPAMEGILDIFKETYVEPTKDRMGVCSRCGVRILSGEGTYWYGHLIWHRNMSLAVFLLQGWALSVMADDNNDAFDEES